MGEPVRYGVALLDALAELPQGPELVAGILERVERRRAYRLLVEGLQSGLHQPGIADLAARFKAASNPAPCPTGAQEGTGEGQSGGAGPLSRPRGF
jgi:hypothetical protein